MATKRFAKGTRQKFWRRQIALQLRSGLSQVEFCRRRGLAPGTLAWWKKNLKRLAGRCQRQPRPAGGPSFVPVRVVPPRSLVAGGFDVELRNGRRIQVPCPFDAESLRELLAILQEPATC
jgi:hypothetical protein